jgi:hypothetical protein
MPTAGSVRLNTERAAMRSSESSNWISYKSSITTSPTVSELSTSECRGEGEGEGALISRHAKRDLKGLPPGELNPAAHPSVARREL